ncbi:DUF2059 domain-containing protein [Longitalea luteola]|uniref:DUF2059 domain-containing protein n=1 Tax=Longitalea luteola TaxID=2812563 RepID=UPI001A9742AD|nr:DUF2059 domain-containing protein [Longitalea luteola]
MKKSLARLICMMFLLTVTVSSIAQSKPTPRTKPAAGAKRPAKPVAKEEDEVIKIGANPNEDEKPPEIEKLEETRTGSAPSPALPPLPDIDTVAAPNDDLTKEIKKLLLVSNALGNANMVGRNFIETQRKSNSGLPDEFFERILQKFDNGTVSGFTENVIIKLYRQKFTLEEIREALKFYETPLGKKIAVELGPIMTKAGTEGEKFGRYLAIKIIEDMMKEGKWK